MPFQVLSFGSNQKRSLALMLLPLASSVQAQSWGGSLSASSDFVYRGVTLSDNKSSAQADLHYFDRTGWFAGAAAYSVQYSSSDPVSAELDGYLGYTWSPTDPWSLRLLGVHHDYPWHDTERRYDYDELSSTLAYADRIFATVAFSPNNAVNRRYDPVSGRATLAYDLALHQPIVGALSANAGVGYYDLRWAVDTGYVYFNGGLSYDFGAVQFELSYIGTSGAAKRLFYPGEAVNRGLATIAWHFK